MLTKTVTHESINQGIAIGAAISATILHTRVSSLVNRSQSLPYVSAAARSVPFAFVAREIVAMALVC